MKRNKSEMSIFLQSWNLLPQPNTLKSFFSGFLPRRFKLFCFKAFSIFLLLSALCSCNHSKKGVPVLFRDGVAPFAEVVNKVEFIPLETDSVHILGEKPELWVEDSCFIVSDWQNASIFRYSLQGKFLNTIGRKGNGPDEFSGIDGWSYEDGLLTVFSYPDKVLNFSLSGELLSRRKISNLGMSSYMVGKDVLTYMGYGTGLNYRAALLDSSSLKKKLIEDTKNNNVFNFTPLSPVITKSQDVFILDPFNPVVYKYDAEELSPYILFDLGRFEVKERYYSFKNPMEAAEYLFSRDYAYINRYAEGSDVKFVEFILTQDGEGKPYHGLYYKGEWRWFSLGGFYDSIGRAFRTISCDDVLYFLVAPECLREIPEEISGTIVNKSCLDGLSDDNNYVVMKVFIK